MLRLYIKPARSNQQNSDREFVQMTTNFKACILISLCVHCLLAQMTTFRVSFLGQTLANHSYVNLSLVGSDISGSDSVQCITDLSTCCTNTEGSHRGDWYFPDGMRLQFTGAIFEKRDAQRVDLRHENNGIYQGESDKSDLHPNNQYYVLGMYHCNIQTTAVNKSTGADADADTSVVYVGLYHSGGEQ